MANISTDHLVSSAGIPFFKLPVNSWAIISVFAVHIVYVLPHIHFSRVRSTTRSQTHRNLPCISFYYSNHYHIARGKYRFVIPFQLLGFQSHRHLQGHTTTSSFYWLSKTSHVRISEYSHVWVEPPTHSRSTGRPPYMRVFSPTGTRT